MVAPDAFAGIHGYFYVVIAGFCLFSAGLAYFYYVETAGHTLEEIAVAFGDKAFLSSDEEIMANAELRKGLVCVGIHVGESLVRTSSNVLGDLIMGEARSSDT